MHPELYQQAKDHLLDMNYADYFYLTAYPEYSGYRIEHDPTLTAYCHFTISEPLPEEPAPSEAPFITTEIAIIAAVVIVAVVGIVAFWALRKRK